MKLNKSFYKTHTLDIAKNLLGKHLCVKHQEVILSGMITETECYRGFDDDASHAHKGMTKRCEVMYKEGGYAYVYFTYGMYFMLNIVTEEKDFPSAVLIRGVDIVDHLDIVSKNRYGIDYSLLTSTQKKNLTNGPGKITKAFGIDKSFNGEDLVDGRIWIEDRGVVFDDSSILITPRIGIDYATNAKMWPWRFLVKR